MKRLFIALSILLLAFSVSASDTSYVNVEETDWLRIQEYVQTSQSLLNEARNELQTLQTDLQTSLNQVETLKISFGNIQEKLNRTQTWNRILIGSLSVSLIINVTMIFLIFRTN